TGTSTAKGMGFILNASLSGSLKDTTGNNLTLSSNGSDSAVHNYIGNRVDDSFIKHLIDSGVAIGSKTEVQKVDIYKKELQKYIDDNKDSNDLVKDFGDWILSFTGIDVDKKGNISFTGAGFSNSNLTAGGNLTLDNGPGNLSLSGSNLTATNGYVNLTGGSGINLNRGNISAQNDITINASNGGVSISGQNSSSGMANITSTAGNISIYGNASGVNQNGIELNNVNLTATRGQISVTGTAGTKTGDMGGAGGILIQNKVIFRSTGNTVNAYSPHPNSGLAAIAFFQGVDVHFIGNTTINTYANGGSYESPGLLFTKKWADKQTVSFENGQADINAVGGIGIKNVGGAHSYPEFHVSNATLNINASSDKGPAIFTMVQGANDGDNAQASGYKFTGDGDINIKGVTSSYNSEYDGDWGNAAGLQLRLFDNTGLNGNFTVYGESVAGPGVLVDRNANISVHNATITGTSQTGPGIQINAGDANHHPVVNLNGNTLTGTSGTGTGIGINGNNVSITNGSLNGTSGGSGAGVELTGGTNYTINGATVSGQSQAGSGVSVGGNLSVSNATVNGTTATGSGVNIGGNLTSSNTSISGTASGNGSGVSLNGNVTGDITEKNVIT
ncbi:hypothetical protein DPU24_27825, partial [Salmonella enterica subsp. enterica serovar Oranienburg]|nr:hypothetical protein [Salmonella enterica subsp. enterica serovar Oranienburg]